jgi:hypothetical protein
LKAGVRLLEMVRHKSKPSSGHVVVAQDDVHAQSLWVNAVPAAPA